MLGGEKTRLVIDTNIWVSFLISKKLRRLLTVFLSETVQMLFDDELLDEVMLVVGRPKYRKYFNHTKIEELHTFIRKTAEFVVVTDRVELCRDPKDDFLLALCKSGDADYLITGDKDLLAIGKFGETQIVTVAEFEETFYASNRLRHPRTLLANRERLPY
ncbi:MAG: putative toxin-antitoxin system toxin component, PIN family [Thermoguttaceae bacterium]